MIVPSTVTPPTLTPPTPAWPTPALPTSALPIRRGDARGPRSAARSLPAADAPAVRK